MLIQFVLTALLLAMLGGTWRRRAKGGLSGRALLGWSALWCAGIVVTWWPNVSTIVASVFGVGRGVDLVIYFLLLFLCYAAFRQTLRIEELERHITALVRKMALEESASAAVKTESGKAATGAAVAAKE